jgi:hypothetical protein
MSQHLTAIASDPTHRHRARTILIALTAVFVRCGLVLRGGQSAHAVGVEIFVVIVGAEVVVFRSLTRALDGSGPVRRGVLLRSLAAALRDSGASQRGVLFRTLGYLGCLIGEQAGAVVLFFGHTWGLYAVGVAMMASFLFIVSGAWLLLVGVESPAEQPVP